MSELKQIPPLIQQMVLRSLGAYCSTYMGNDLYYLVRAVYLLKAQLDDDELREDWEKKGYNYEKTMKMIEKIDKKATEVKNFYDAIEDKKFENKTKELKVKRYFIKTSSKIPPIQQEFYDFFVFLINKCQIKHQTIRNEYFKILEHQNFRNIALRQNNLNPMSMMQPDSQFQNSNISNG